MMNWFLTILGWSWVALGIWWMLRPHGIKRRMERKFASNLRRGLLAALFLTGGLLLNASRELHGALRVVIIVVGVIALLQGLLFVRGKTLETFQNWWGERSVLQYRIVAICFAAVGYCLQWAARTMGT